MAYHPLGRHLPGADVNWNFRLIPAGHERCGKQPTWACTIAELEKTKNVETGIMAPISFGPGVRFSNQKLQIMQADFPTLSFKPVN